MITGDHPVTAVAIARQCNIMRDKTNEEIIEEAKEKGAVISEQAAFDQAQAVVIHGHKLAKMMAEKDGKQRLEQWLMKPQVVFARTSPAQKMQIVECAQELGHIVAVTGDGVNDSPAIKRADIGVAMGIMGSDAAKEAADMVLLSDDFSAIVIGVEEGRKIFDNMKKTIVYIMTSNIPELVPFLIFVVTAIPLPLPAVLVLCIDIGTDMLPSVAFSYEDAELDIMTRAPRLKWEHLVTQRLLVFAYFQAGMIQTMAAFMNYIVILNDFGFKITELPGMANRRGVKPYERGNYFDPDALNFGNGHAYCRAPNRISGDNGRAAVPPDWDTTRQGWMDLRLYFLKCVNNRIEPVYQWTTCNVTQLSPITNRPICYTTEALRYAQAGFFYGVVVCQWINALNCKTRKISFMHQTNNFFMYFSIYFETVVMLMMAYLYPLNVIFGTRDTTFFHLGAYSVPLAIFQMIHDETRKYLIRNWPQPDPVTPNWFERNSLW
jgi:sodium/potassium-transporting ATPase subunit alpha